MQEMYILKSDVTTSANSMWAPPSQAQDRNGKTSFLHWLYPQCFSWKASMISIFAMHFSENLTFTNMYVVDILNSEYSLMIVVMMSINYIPLDLTG